LTRVEQKIITQQAKDFIKGKGMCVQEENHIYILDYMVVNKIVFLSRYYFLKDIFPYKYVENKGMVYLFDVKRKKKFITLLIHLGNTIVNTFSYIKELSQTLNAFNIKETQPLRGFNPEGFFSEHLASMR